MSTDALDSATDSIEYNRYRILDESKLKFISPQGWDQLAIVVPNAKRIVIREYFPVCDGYVKLGRTNVFFRNSQRDNFREITETDDIGFIDHSHEIKDNVSYQDVSESLWMIRLLITCGRRVSVSVDYFPSHFDEWLQRRKMGKYSE